ncbi:hypothetical protein ACFLU6_00800 [Acidobacteriota bacterium]
MNVPNPDEDSPHLEDGTNSDRSREKNGVAPKFKPGGYRPRVEKIELFNADADEQTATGNQASTAADAASSQAQGLSSTTGSVAVEPEPDTTDQEVSADDLAMVLDDGKSLKDEESDSADHQQISSSDIVLEESDSPLKAEEVNSHAGDEGLFIDLDSSVKDESKAAQSPDTPVQQDDDESSEESPLSEQPAVAFDAKSVREEQPIGYDEDSSNVQDAETILNQESTDIYGAGETTEQGDNLIASQTVDDPVPDGAGDRDEETDIEDRIEEIAITFCLLKEEIALKYKKDRDEDGKLKRAVLKLRKQITAKDEQIAAINEQIAAKDKQIEMYTAEISNLKKEAERLRNEQPKRERLIVEKLLSKIKDGFLDGIGSDGKAALDGSADPSSTKVGVLEAYVQHLSDLETQGDPKFDVFLKEKTAELKVYTRQGIDEKCIGVLREILDTYPDDLTTLKAIKDLYLATGDQQSASQQCITIARIFREQGDDQHATAFDSEAKLLLDL